MIPSLPKSAITIVSTTLAALTTLVFGVVPAAARPLTFEERVRAQAAIERIDYSHQLGTTRPFEQAVPETVLEEKVRTYLKQSEALERLWNTPVTEEMLQRELERMARQTRMPERLRELYSALGDDPTLIQECLARPALVNRLSRSFFSHDQTIQHEAYRAAERMHQRLETGQIDPSAEHPSRTVADYQRLIVEAVSGPAVESGRPTPIVTVPTEEFDRLGSLVPKRVGEVGPLVEEDARFLVRVALERGPDRLRVATFTVEKRSWDDWWREEAGRLDETRVAAVASAQIALPVPSSGPGCTDGTWDNGSLDDTPVPRKWHTAVWTGSRMIVWAGETAGNTGALYDPATDTWTPTSTTNAPQARLRHVAVWTGSEMLAWGGSLGVADLNTGGRYDPVADSWTTMSTVGAPSARADHTAVWTGKEMVIWGGSSDAGVPLSSGGRYNPATDTWAAISMTGVPSPRYSHTAIWTGSLMIVWGGSADATGGRYDPATDAWTPTSLLNAATGRVNHSAVWTGSEMLVWGGSSPDGTMTYNTGARYRPATDSWAPMSTMNAPTGRSHPTAVWTGSVMVVWGGYVGSYLNTGGRYDPSADAWSASTTLNAPAGRALHTAIWTGRAMVVWGGWNGGRFFNSGGRYDPAADVWTPTSTGGAPSGRSGHVAVWTGSVMIVWGGQPDTSTGGRYDPATDSWAPTSTMNAPTAHGGYSAVWTGSEMIVWGGANSTTTVFYNNGGRYDPINDTWKSTSTLNAPVARTGHTAVWTGSVMVIWSGYDYIPPPLGRYFFLNTGGRYDPATDTWTPTSTLNAPTGRYNATSVWSGNVAIVWGGYGEGTPPIVGGKYDPVADSWSPTAATNAPAGRTQHTAVWTGSRMVIWGGGASGGGRYDPIADSWSSVSTLDAPPTPDSGHVAVWSGQEMLVWGGNYTKSGGRYDPSVDAWRPTSPTDAPPSVFGMTAVWDGDAMVVWGGHADWPGVDFNTGGRYCACASKTYFRDSDGDGYGDPGVSMQACVPPVGYVASGSDCDDADPGLWGAPSEVMGLLVADPFTITWQPPASPGAANVLYDLIRSGNPNDFGAGAVCVVSGSPTLSASEGELPAIGRMFAYLARAQSGCLDGQGPLGSDSSGHPRVGRSCP